MLYTEYDLLRQGVLENAGNMWERNLQDLIRGLRAHRNDEARFIASAIDEIRGEVRSEDMELKAAAVVKLTYVCVLSHIPISRQTYFDIVRDARI